jgi:hypothetical protein
MNQIKVVVGEELFRFKSFAEWVNKAQGWFQGHRKYICIDEAGRVCESGAEFGRADREYRFPVVVYSINPKEKKIAARGKSRPTA